MPPWVKYSVPSMPMASPSTFMMLLTSGRWLPQPPAGASVITSVGGLVSGAPASGWVLGGLASAPASIAGGVTRMGSGAT
jgi:hypothetical protein